MPYVRGMNSTYINILSEPIESSKPSSIDDKLENFLQDVNIYEL